MNFHKTIGFLATFLLMLGIGVPDVFAADVGDISFSVTPRNLRESSGDGTSSDNLAARLSVSRTGAIAAAATYNITFTLTHSTKTRQDNRVLGFSAVASANTAYDASNGSAGAGPPATYSGVTVTLAAGVRRVDITDLAISLTGYRQCRFRQGPYCYNTGVRCSIY